MQVNEEAPILDIDKRIKEFCTKLPKNIPVVLIFSQSGTKFANSFESDRGNEALAEEFLRYGFGVVYVHNTNSQLPFTSNFPSSNSDLIEVLQVQESGDIILRYPEDRLQEQLFADLRSLDACNRKGTLLMLPLPNDALEMLILIAKNMHIILSERSRMLFIKCSSVDENPLLQACTPQAFMGCVPTNSTPTLSVDGIVCQYLSWLMERDQLHIHATVNQFRNQARSGIAAWTGAGYQGKETQSAIKEGDTGDPAAGNPTSALETRKETDFVASNHVSSEALRLVLTLLLGVALGFGGAKLIDKKK